MLRNKKVVVVMPAYNAAKTLQSTHAEVLEQEIVDEVIIVDDASHDDTIAIARTLPRTIVHIHEKNLGYGGNQKSCYRLALEHRAKIIIKVHPDYQYTPKLVPLALNFPPRSQVALGNASAGEALLRPASGKVKGKGSSQAAQTSAFLSATWERRGKLLLRAVG